MFKNPPPHTHHNKFVNNINSEPLTCDTNIIQKEYFKNIDIFRVILILSIILCHSFIFFKSFNCPIFKYIILHNKFSHIAVDMFFVISGFFLFYTTNFAKENFYSFVKKRLIRLLPSLIFAFILYYVISSFCVLDVRRYENIWSLFLLQNIGITINYTNIGASWFISAMFWTSCLFFYAYKNIKKEYFNLILALLVIFCYSFMIHNNILRTITNYYSVINVGMIRAIASMGLGYFIWNIYVDKLGKLKSINFSLVNRLIITAVELYLFIFVFKNLLVRTMRYNNYLLLILMFSLLFILFLLNKGYVSRLFNNKVSEIIGRYVYPILLIHEFIRDFYLKVVYAKYHIFAVNYPVHSYLIYLFTVILIGILIYHFIEKPVVKYLKSKL